MTLNYLKFLELICFFYLLYKILASDHTLVLSLLQLELVLYLRSSRRTVNRCI